MLNIHKHLKRTTLLLFLAVLTQPSLASIAFQHKKKARNEGKTLPKRRKTKRKTWVLWVGGGAILLIGIYLYRSIPPSTDKNNTLPPTRRLQKPFYNPKGRKLIK